MTQVSTAPTPVADPQAQESLSLTALQIAHPYLSRTKKLTLRDREADFRNSVNFLTSLPSFTKEGAEGAAEFLKSEAAQQRHFWLRFGTSGGSYIAATLPILTLVMLMDTTAPAVLTGVISGVLFAAVFAIGAQLDPVQDLFQTAESMLKSAAKQPQGPFGITVPGVSVNLDVEQLLQRAHRKMLRTAVAGIIIAALLAWIIGMVLANAT